MSLKQFIKKNKITYVNPEIEKGIFPFVKPKKMEYKVFHFNRYISSEDVVKEIEKEGYTPATYSELMLWPDWNRTDFVVALGSVAEVHGDRSVPYLNEDGSKRGLDLFWWAIGWVSRCRFLAVRNLSSGSRSSDSVLEPLETQALPDELVINGVTYIKQ